MLRLCVFWLLGLATVPALAAEAKTFRADFIGNSVTDAIGPGDHTRTILVGDLQRSYLIHIPEKYDPKTQTPVVLVFHGAGTNALTLS